MDKHNLTKDENITEINYSPSEWKEKKLGHFFVVVDIVWKKWFRLGDEEMHGDVGHIGKR